MSDRYINKVSVAGVLMEGWLQKVEGEAIADLAFGVGTPERAAYEEQLKEMMKLDFEQLVDILRERVASGS